MKSGIFSDHNVMRQEIKHRQITVKNKQTNKQTYEHMEAKRYITKQPVDHWRNQRGNKKIPLDKWQQKHHNPKPTGWKQF